VRALTNPYTPNAGAEPQAVVGRDDQLAWFDLLLARIERGRTEQSMIITGLRGVGKTVLLGQFRTKALEHDWVVVRHAGAMVLLVGVLLLCVLSLLAGLLLLRDWYCDHGPQRR